MSYSQFMGNMKKAEIQLNRKMLAQIAVLDPAGFDKVVQAVASGKG
jgi:large subunit ribosomal protein L20